MWHVHLLERTAIISLRYGESHPGFATRSAVAPRITWKVKLHGVSVHYESHYAPLLNKFLGKSGFFLDIECEVADLAT